VSASGGYWVNVKRIDATKESQFDPSFGFEGKERVPRVMVATEAEMVSAKVPHMFRDYCAHLYIAYQGCKKQKAPFFYRCHHEKHEYETCEMEDYVIRMKEFEREERLLKRKQRIEAKARAREAQERREAGGDD